MESLLVNLLRLGSDRLKNILYVKWTASLDYIDSFTKYLLFRHLSVSVGVDAVVDASEDPVHLEEVLVFDFGGLVGQNGHWFVHLHRITADYSRLELTRPQVLHQFFRDCRLPHPRLSR